MLLPDLLCCSGLGQGWQHYTAKHIARHEAQQLCSRQSRPYELSQQVLHEGRVSPALCSEEPSRPHQIKGRCREHSSRSVVLRKS